jgi:hypothetical protein
MAFWSVNLSRSAAKQYEKLKRNGSKRPSVIDAIDLLVMDLQRNGPYVTGWPNYGSLDTNVFHCHLRKGRPTYVACWKVTSKINKEIEVFYVGTHEDTPY